MGWEEDFLQKAVDTCTNESGMIQDCPIFDIIDESKAKECEIKMPLELVAEKVLDGLSLLPGDVQITYEGDSAEPAKPSSSSSAPGLLPSDPADLLPGNVFKESSASTSTTSQDVAAAAAPAPTTTTSTSTSSPTPTTTPTPSVAPVDPSVSYESTQYITNGNMVTKILWDEEVVWVTEMVDTTTTVTITGGPPPSPTPDPTPEPAAAAPAGTDAKRRRHVHHHGHNHHRL